MKRLDFCVPLVAVMLAACAPYAFAPNKYPPGCGGGGEWRLTTQVGLRTKVILDDLQWDAWTSGVAAGTTAFRVQRPSNVGMTLLISTDQAISDLPRSVTGEYVVPMNESRLCVYESPDRRLVFQKVGR